MIAHVFHDCNLAVDLIFAVLNWQIVTISPEYLT